MSAERYLTLVFFSSCDKWKDGRKDAFKKSFYVPTEGGLKVSASAVANIKKEKGLVAGENFSDPTMTFDQIKLPSFVTQKSHRQGFGEPTTAIQTQVQYCFYN